ncbi:MAG: hypothetical protein C4K49_10755 [Candidatus Thorarchaeota archaeon]|nr:MAG: hypothetical protein C4K49_10755 [Candidatus Thorarchaeota archaeon]
MKTSSSSLKNRYAESARTKDSGGSNGPFSFPSETKFYKAKEARNRLIILSFPIKTKKHPLVAKGRWKIGDYDYVMDVWVHQRFGGGDQDFVCLKKNYNKPCPCCELAEEYRQAGKEEEYKAAKASRRVVYNVLDARSPEKGVMIFSTSHYLFEHELIEEAIASGVGGEPVDFAVDFLRKDENGRVDLGVENGKVISFRGAMTKLGQNEYLEFKSFSFETRDESLPRDIQSEVISLDEALTVMSYDDMQSAVYGQDDDEEEEERGESGRGRGEEQDERPNRSNRDDDRERGSDREDDHRPSRDDDRPRERDRDQDRRRDEPREEKPKDEPKGDTCPAGYKFPDDWDKKPECSKCKVWDRCGDALEATKKAKK